MVEIVFQNVLAISVGSVVAIYALSGNLQEPIRQLSTVVSEYKKNNATFKLKCFSFAKEKIEKCEVISFKSKGLTFDNKTILKDVNFNLDIGKNNAICCGSAIGKSTIFSFLLGNQAADNIVVFLRL